MTNALRAAKGKGEILARMHPREDPRPLTSAERALYLKNGKKVIGELECASSRDETLENEPNTKQGARYPWGTFQTTVISVHS